MTPFASEIAAAAAKHQLSPTLLAAQVSVESSFRVDAFRYEPLFYATYIKGNAGARGARFGPLAACSFGLLQIMLEVACELGFTGNPQDLFVPAVGLDWGAHYLASLLAWAGGDYTRAFCAYNGGKGGNGAPPLRNQAYADKVFTAETLLT